MDIPLVVGFGVSILSPIIVGSDTPVNQTWLAGKSTIWFDDFPSYKSPFIGPSITINNHHSYNSRKH